MKRELILVVDDEARVREAFREFLKAKGYEVIIASSGEEAVTAVEEQRPQLILLDIMMPGMNGLETLQRIREIDRAVGVIMLTAIEDEEIAKAAMGKEAYDYVTKPVDLGYLEVAILAKLARLRGGGPGG